MRTPLAPLTALPLLAWMGCASVDAPPPPDAAPPPDVTPDVTPDATPDVTPDAMPVAPRPEVRWEPCPLHSEGEGPDAECATVATPLDARRPAGPTIEVFVKRFRPKGGRSLRALWMLQGGPGASGYAFESIAESFATRFPDVDYYMPDHRGTGRSSRLSCADQEADGSPGGPLITEAEWPACLAAVRAREGDRLAAFNTTNAANDIGVLVEATRRAGQPVFVLGVSYGTYWAHRYLQLFPRQADGVVFDSVAPPGLSLFRQDEDANEAARDFFGVCGRDAFCRSKLGDDPWSVAERLVARLKAGHCAQIAVPSAPTHVLFRRAFASLLMNPPLRAYVPAVVYRANRCEGRDIGALRVFMRAASQPPQINEDLRLWGWILSANIIVSEFNESPALTAAQLAAIREGAVASRDVTQNFEVHLGRWPTYPREDLWGRYADTASPLLFLQGGLDPATLLRRARAMRPHFTRPHQHWVEIPTASHTTFVSSPFVDESGENRSCGTRILMRFLEAPTAALDTSCVARVRPIDFTLPRTDLTQALFGTTNAWE